MNRRTMVVASLAITLALAMAAPVGVTAKGRPASEATNNLSVPTIMVGGGITGPTCATAPDASALAYPSGTPQTGYPLDPSAYWWVQKVHRWQAQCMLAASTSARGDWGDNLTGDAKLRAGKPIRVELGLIAENTGGLQGFAVEKLEPSKLDRESAYGTLAKLDGDQWVGIPGTPADLRVYDGQATFSIQNVATGAYVVQPGTTAKGEINATGKVVYGYQLKVMTKGDYAITYHLPNVNVLGADAGTTGPDTVTLIITII